MRKGIPWFIFIILTVLFTACSTPATQPHNSSNDKVNSRLTDMNGVRISISQDGEKELFHKKDGKLVMVYGGKEKVIYENYRSVTNNPYSVWDFDEYKVQWSEDSNYVYIVDSVYDIKGERLIPIEDCVIFSWISNKGVFLADGRYYEISYDGALQNQMAVGKKIKMIENGTVKEIGKQRDDRYYVRYEGIDVKQAFETLGDYLVLNTASLKYDEEQLQGKIRETLHSEDFRSFLRSNHDEELKQKTQVLFDKIKEMKEFQELKNEILHLENNYPMEFEGNTKKLITLVDDDTYCHYNVSGKYFLRDMRREEVKFK